MMKTMTVPKTMRRNGTGSINGTEAVIDDDGNGDDEDDDDNANTR